MTVTVFCIVCITLVIILFVVGIIKVRNGHKLKYEGDIDDFFESDEYAKKKEELLKSSIEKSLNTYYECSVCGKIITYHDVKDYIVPYDLALYNGDHSKIITSIYSSAPYSRLEGAQSYNKVQCTEGEHYHIKPSKVQLTQLHGHEYITYEYALQYAQGLAMCKDYEATIRATQKAQEYINKRLDSKK